MSHCWNKFFSYFFSVVFYLVIVLKWGFSDGLHQDWYFSLPLHVVNPNIVIKLEWTQPIVHSKNILYFTQNWVYFWSLQPDALQSASGFIEVPQKWQHFVHLHPILHVSFAGREYFFFKCLFLIRCPSSLDLPDSTLCWFRALWPKNKFCWKQ